MNTFDAKPYLLFNKIQHYDWGTKDEEAFIPRLIGLAPQPGKPYAELWIGTHPNAPSEILYKDTVSSLQSIIEKYPNEMLGEFVIRQFGQALPFLLKVLSAAKALSIQTHPDKEQALHLHSRDPHHYPDENHKPEIAIALDRLEAVAGFRPVEEIAGLFGIFPELNQLIDPAIIAAMHHGQSTAGREAAARSAYEQMMKRSVRDGSYEKIIVSMIDRIRSQRLSHPVATLMLAQAKHYPGDIGLLSFLFLNYIELESGQGIFTRAGIPHAYIVGNIVECMANSDNVIRAGLTPKFKDIDSLLEVIRYEFAPYEILNKEQSLDHVHFHTSAKEFQLTMYSHVTPSATRIDTGGKPVILLITEGNCTLHWEREIPGEPMPVTKGESVFIPAALDSVTIRNASTLMFFTATVPS